MPAEDVPLLDRVRARLRPTRRPVPDVVRAVALERGDRRLAWALTDAGEPVVATERGLLLPGRPLLPWVRVERAGWHEQVMTVREVAEVEGTGPAVTLRLADPGDLPALVRTRVTASVTWSTHARLPAGGGVRVVGRRRPGQDALDWQLVFDRGTDTGSPEVRAQAQQLLDDARRAIG